MSAPLKLNRFETFFLSTFLTSSSGFQWLSEPEIQDGLQGIEHRTTAAWIESLFSTGLNDLVLCQLSEFLSVDGLHGDLSSDCIWVTVWEWWNSSGREREVRVRGKMHMKEGSFEGFGDRFLVGWGVVRILLEGGIVVIVLEWERLLGFFLSGEEVLIVLAGFVGARCWEWVFFWRGKVFWHCLLYCPFFSLNFRLCPWELLCSSESF